MSEGMAEATLDELGRTVPGLSAWSRRAWRSQIARLGNALEEGEQVAALALGYRGLERCVVAATSRRLVIAQSGTHHAFSFGDLAFVHAKQRVTGGELTVQTQNEKVVAKSLIPPGSVNELARLAREGHAQGFIDVERAKSERPGPDTEPVSQGFRESLRRDWERTKQNSAEGRGPIPLAPRSWADVSKTAEGDRKRPAWRQRMVWNERYCPRCERVVKARRERAHHPMNGALTVLTLGLWAPAWAAEGALSAAQPYRCAYCDGHTQPVPDARIPTAEELGGRSSVGHPTSAPAPSGGKQCPDCAEWVREEARVCRFCRHEFDGGAHRP